MRFFRLKLHWQILLALALAVLASVVIQLGDLGDTRFAAALIGTAAFMGKIFMNALKLVMVPLIVSTVICGIMAIGSQRDFGRLGAKTLGYYSLTGLLAVVTGLFFVNVIGPGKVSLETAQSIIGQGKNAGAVLEGVGEHGASDLVEIFVRMVPPNVVAAAADNGQLLGLIVVGLVTGFFITRLPDKHRETQVSFWESAQELMMRITDFVIKFAPLGVFGLVKSSWCSCPRRALPARLP
jgi:Na+/H+-dicarboxylate symporter